MTSADINDPAGAPGIGTFAGPDGEEFPGLVRGDAVVDLRSRFGPAATTLALLETYGGDLDRLVEATGATNGDATALADLQPRVPVQSRQVLCAGANYSRHVHSLAFANLRHGGDTRSDEDLRAAAVEIALGLGANDPFIFAGLPSALSGAQDDIVLWGPGQHHDWELELAVVIGRGGRDIPVEQAMDHIAGYTISNDISTRDMVARPGFPMSDLIVAKCRPGFFPTGPFMIPRSWVPDPTALRLTLSVNGEIMQDDSPADLIHGIDRLIAYASRVIELFPGDLLLTGSPAGNAVEHGNRWLQPGDLIESSISGLGRQQNRCVAVA